MANYLKTEIYQKILPLLLPKNVTAARKIFLYK